MAPYARFLEAAKTSRYDTTILKHRFNLSFEQVCHRLTTLRRPGAEGVPFHLIRVDIAGNISKRFSSSGIHIARFGAACPRWNVYDAFATPGCCACRFRACPMVRRFSASRARSRQAVDRSCAAACPPAPACSPSASAAR